MMKRIVAVAVAALLFAAGPLAAAVPDVFRLQGFLTDGLDVPINGQVSMTIGLYDAKIGGSLIKSVGPLLVDVNQGVYEVVTGFTSNDFQGGAAFHGPTN